MFSDTSGDSTADGLLSCWSAAHVTEVDGVNRSNCVL